MPIGKRPENPHLTPGDKPIDELSPEEIGHIKHVAYMCANDLRLRKNQFDSEEIRKRVKIIRGAVADGIINLPEMLLEEEDLAKLEA
ncbi:hypothetical protein K8R42_02165 [bacterium]|nr:hypothetical protein [bacterium]